jgi:hypothetical protein
VNDYFPFDQAEKLGEPPWSGPALKAWEEAHGHDARLKCYPEFNCQLSYVLVEDVIEALDAIDNYAAKDLDHELHSIVDHYRRALGVHRG